MKYLQFFDVDSDVTTILLNKLADNSCFYTLTKCPMKVKNKRHWRNKRQEKKLHKVVGVWRYGEYKRSRLEIVYASLNADVSVFLKVSELGLGEKIL